jgi:predicted nucleotidyltransferase
MSALTTVLARVCDLLNREGARYLVVGGRALQLWGSTRATRDIDILIDPTVENAASVLRALGQMGFGFAKEWLAEEIIAKPVTIIGDMQQVDILTIAWSVKYQQAAPRATNFTVDGVTIPTIAIDDLIASKRTGRLQDAADIEVLEEIKRLRA